MALPWQVGVLFKELQAEFDRLLLAKAAEPSLDITAQHSGAQMAGSGNGRAFGALEAVAALVCAEEWEEEEDIGAI